MMNRALLYLFVLLLAWLPGGCGGGAGGGIELASSGGSGGGIGGTGLTSSGTIDGFGSVFVNGIEFDTAGAEILVDGQRVGEQALGIGMVVLVVGEVNADGTTGTASRIVFDAAVRGPVQAITRDQDGDSMLLQVMDLEVIVERTGSVFEGLSFDSVKPGDLVAVSGFVNTQGRLRATRIEKKEDFLPGVSVVQLKGVVGALNGTDFTLGGFTVDASGADLSALPDGVLVSALRVEVTGTLDPDRAHIVASRITPQAAVAQVLPDDEEVSLQGFVADFVSAANFRVNGIVVDASTAVMRPADLVLGNGVLVEVEGSRSNGILRAQRLEGRRGRVEIEAAVASVDTASRSVTLQLAAGTVTVELDNRTLLEDDTDRVARLKLADIGSGDFLEIEAIRLGDSLLATRIDRERADDDVLQAPLQAFVAGGSVTLLGITFSTENAEFQAEDDVPLSAGQFYDALQPGLLVKVKDRRPADGIADEVEFELEMALDGDREFERDDEIDEADEPDEPDEPDSP